MNWDDAARARWRAALRIRPHLLAARERRHDVGPSDAAWSAVRRSFDRAHEARRRRWDAATREADLDAARGLAELLAALQRAAEALRHRREAPGVATEADLFGDLQALAGEFDEVEVDLRAKEVRAVTDPVVLEGIDLGRFRIVLDWSALGQRHPYFVEALDPCPAESNEELLHPHVHDSILCEGDGQHAIRQALEQGRLLDFFVLVRQVLTTYNPASAYLQLDRWQGEPCQGCGYLTDRGESYTCACCHDLFCGDCTGGCAACLDSVCQECLAPCPHCEQSYCRSCMTDCAACGRPGCDGCLREGACPSCRETQSDDPEDETHDDATEGAAGQAEGGPALQPVRLGEVPVPA